MPSALTLAPSLVPSAATFAAAAVLSGAIAWAGPIDPPTERGAHHRPTPTSGGVAIMGALGLGLLLNVIHVGPTAALKMAITLGLALAMAVIGALDDLFDVGAGTKLALQAAIALAFAIFVAHVERLPLGFGLTLPLGPIVGTAGVALWIVVASNAVNFMDGANGVAPGAQICLFTSTAIAAVLVHNALVAEAATAAAIACAGFLPWNLKGLLFQGDAGALLCGFLFASLAILLAAPATPDGQALSLYFGPLVLLPFLTDVLLTLAVRARRGESLMQAHRDHLYQLWLRQTPRPSHVALAWRMMLIMAVYGGLGLALLACPARAQPPMFVAAVAVSALSWVLLRRRLEQRARPLG